MRRERITYPGAYHHVMNRGHDGNNIFAGDENKNHFLNYLEDYSKKMHIRLFAYCIMDNHYHLILENSSGRMSDFLKQLNGQYGQYYRKREGGKGYVFQGRYKSTSIENDAYLLQSIRYLLQNPVRAGIVQNASSYIWSSIHYYFSNNKTKIEIVDAEYVNQLFGTRQLLVEGYEKESNYELPVKKTEHGEFLGSEIFMKNALKLHNRRKKPTEQSIGNQRKDDRFFEPIERVFWEFKNIHGVDGDHIDTRTWEGKRLRGELLVLLKERAGLKYKEIGEFIAFSDLSFKSLGGLYRRAKKTREQKE
jgi:REP element-mobilizing transposase RayT